MKNKARSTPRTVAGAMTSMVRPLSLPEISSGLIMDAIPIERRGSVMFEPISVPIATPLLRFAAMRAIVSSGRDVPIPDTVVPTTECGTSRRIAKS